MNKFFISTNDALCTLCGCVRQQRSTGRKLKMKKQEKDRGAFSIVPSGNRIGMKVKLPQDVIPKDASGVGDVLDCQMSEIHSDGLRELYVPAFSQRRRDNFAVKETGGVPPRQGLGIVVHDDGRRLRLRLQYLLESVKGHEDQPDDAGLAAVQQSAPGKFHAIVRDGPPLLSGFARENFQLAANVARVQYANFHHCGEEARTQLIRPVDIPFPRRG